MRINSNYEEDKVEKSLRKDRIEMPTFPRTNSIVSLEVGEDIFFAQYLGKFENDSNPQVAYHKFIRKSIHSSSILEYRVYDLGIKSSRGHTSIEVLDEEMIVHEKGRSASYDSLNEKLRKVGL